MKIAILTIQNAFNHGSTLQAMALKDYVISLGHECEVLDFQNEILNNIYRKKKEYSIALKYLFSGHVKTAYQEYKDVRLAHKARPYKKIKRSYDKFRKKHLSLTKKVYLGQDDKLSEYDAIICGSDQVWNKGIVGDYGWYYLDILNFTGKKIAYAASGKIDGGEPEKQINLIKKLDKISVREEELKNQLIEYGVKDISVVCDPTLLFDKSYWQKFVKKQKNHVDYIFSYFIYDCPTANEYAKKLSKQTGLPVLHMERISKFLYCNGKKIKSSAPDDFLSLIANCKYFITNSFHGTVFAVTFNKNFSVFKDDQRLKTLLGRLDLSDRISSYDKVTCADIKNKIDWAEISNKMLEFSKSGKDFLSDALLDKR